MSGVRSTSCAFLAVVVVIGGNLLGSTAWGAKAKPSNPAINPADFDIRVAHKYFTLEPGTKFTYRRETRNGTERVEAVVLRETKQVMGVTATVVRETEWLNGKLIEDTRNWYAQDRSGNVWYFGEVVDNYKDGKIHDHDGSWEAGVKSATPAIVMLKDPKEGETFPQGSSEDLRTVVSVGASVSVPQGKFEDCIKVRDWNKEEGPAVSKHKYFCAGLGYLALKEAGRTGSSRVERAELISVSRD
jgi:hypothetical protein